MKANTATVDNLQQIVCRVGGLTAIGPDDVMMDAGFSSMNALELLVELEDTYNISIPDDSFIAVRSVRDLHQLVEGLTEGAPV